MTRNTHTRTQTRNTHTHTNAQHTHTELCVSMSGCSVSLLKSVPPQCGNKVPSGVESRVLLVPLSNFGSPDLAERKEVLCRPAASYTDISIVVRMDREAFVRLGETCQSVLPKQRLSFWVDWGRGGRPSVRNTGGPDEHMRSLESVKAKPLGGVYLHISLSLKCLKNHLKWPFCAKLFTIFWSQQVQRPRDLKPVGSDWFGPNPEVTR